MIKGGDVMASYQIHKILKSIAEETFPDKEIKPFFVEVHAKEMRTRHGDYRPSDRKIRIFNLSRSMSYTIGTAVHELAHHCQYSFDGSTDHSERFYEVFRKLLETSIRVGLVNYEELRTQQDANDINMLEKKFGKLDIIYNKNSNFIKDDYLVKVFNSFVEKNYLKKCGYFFNPAEKSWIKEIKEEEIENEKNLLAEKIDAENIKIERLLDFNIEAIYYIIVKGGFEERDELKKNGYRFNGYKFKNKSWIKKIPASSLKEEEAFLRNINLKFYIEN